MAWMLYLHCSRLNIVSLLGTFFSLAALADCSFVSVFPGIAVSEGEDEVSLVTRLGFITFEHPDHGTCYWYNEGGNAEDQIRDYWDFLGSDWTVARILGGAGAAGGILFLMFSLSMCCSSHFLAVRLFMSFLLWLVLTLFQCMTFLVFSSDICTENECEFSRSAGWSVGAAACFSLSGFCHVLMRDYPGRRPVQSTPAAPKPVPVLEEQAPLDEEAVPAQENEEDAEEDPIENKEDVEEESVEKDEQVVVAADDEEIVVKDEAPGGVTEEEVIVDEEDPELPPASEEPQASDAVEEAKRTETFVDEAEVEESAMEEAAPEDEKSTQEEIASPENTEATNEP
jgi:hypothetical protein